MDDTEDDREDGRWMTYTELARIRTINKESAIRLARRERWRKMPGNDTGGTVRVFVPEDWLKPAREDTSQGNPTPIREGIPEDLRQLTVGWEQAIAISRIRAEAAEARAEKAETRADLADADRRTAEARADGLQERLANLEADLRAKDTELAEQQGVAKQADVARQEAQDAAEALRRAHEARRGKGRLRRAWDGWRGR